MASGQQQEPGITKLRIASRRPNMMCAARELGINSDIERGVAAGPAILIGRSAAAMGKRQFNEA